MGGVTITDFVTNSKHFFTFDFLLRSIVGFISFASIHAVNVLVLFLTTLIVYVFASLVIRFLILRKHTKTPHTLLQIIPPQFSAQSSYATNQLITLIHGFAHNTSIIDRLFNNHKQLSLEIVSTKNEGLRFLVRLPSVEVESFKHLLVSYMQGVETQVIDDYLLVNSMTSVMPICLSKHYAFPLKNQSDLEVYDPIASITGTMTKLETNDVMAMQVVISPVSKHFLPDLKLIRNLLSSNSDLEADLQDLGKGHNILSLIQYLILMVLNVLFLPIGIIIFFFTDGREGPFIPMPNTPLVNKVRDPYNEELQTVIKQKIDQPLFRASVRFLVQTDNSTNLSSRMRNLINSISVFSTHYQSMIRKKAIFKHWFVRINFMLYRLRTHDLLSRTILSVSELSNLYHFPYFKTTKTEGIRKVFSKQLPAPLSLKNTKDLDVTFGVNTFASESVPIGLTDDDRSRHVYLIGQTGSGKTTIMFHMAKQDIEKKRGLAVIDPHGDLAEDLLSTVSLSRKNDLIYLNPFDIAYPVGINLLELTPGILGDELELEKELVCESVISIFRRVFSKEENTDAHRIEYILRNTIHTAFTVPDATIFTIYDLLNDQNFRESVIEKLTDDNLKLFWNSEFGMAGDYQVVKMVSGVTAKVGRFLFSPTAKRILGQPKSTINFDDIINSQKILICNLSEGKLGEDTSQLLGTTIIAKIQQAAIRRSRINLTDRTAFYLFVDEFQNFAMSSFTKLLSGSRKFGLRITIAEQSTSQQSDRNIVDVILANTGTVICFRTASPVDESLMLRQFSPQVELGEISSLPRYHFYIRLSALEPESPFSGTTLPMKIRKDLQTIEALITASRNNYALRYVPPQPKLPVKKSFNTISQPEADIGILA